MLPKKLQQKLVQRKQNNALRKLKIPVENLVDFSSNDYLGFSKNADIFSRTEAILKAENLQLNGATGSRLLSGNHKLYSITEDFIAKTHHVESALIFNSGYDANVGFFSSVPQRGDMILYDEFIHASIRDGIKMSNAKAYKFKHNDLEDLESKLSLRAQSRSQDKENQSEIYIVTESVFSMDGDTPDLKAIVDLCEKYKAYFIVDEAHAIGVFGTGLIDNLKLGQRVTRLVTFGKAIGCHGAAILGSADLKEYLVNFARSLIYTTALSPHSVATILAAYQHAAREAKKTQSDFIKLNENIQFFCQEVKENNLQKYFISSNSAIQSAIITGNKRVKKISLNLKEEGFDVKAILSPTVPAGEERLRFCLHSYNSKRDIKEVLSILKKALNSPES